LGGSFDRDDGKVIQARNARRETIDIYDVPAARLGAVRADASWYHPEGKLALYGAWMNSLLNISADIENGYDFMNTKDEGLSGEIDAIGYGWYSTSGMPPTYSVPNNTYIIKTAEEKFALFQPETFVKDGKSFVMDFSYEYQE
jgi:hypothetical protein